MRRRINWLILTWAPHRMGMGAYRRNTGQFPYELLSNITRTSPLKRNRILYQGIYQIELLMTHCTSTYQALPRLLTRGPLPWPFLAMARVCFEASTRICYVLDPQIPMDQRFMRFAALIAWSQQESGNAIRAQGETLWPGQQELLDKLNQEKTIFEEYLNDCGFSIDRTSKPVIKDLSGQMKSESSVLNLVDTTSNQFPGIGEAFYRRFSGFTHGAPWALYTAQSPSDSNESAPSLDRMTIVDTFQLVGSSVNNAINQYASYSGIPFGIIKWQLANLSKVSEREMKKQIKRFKSGKKPRHLGSKRPQHLRWDRMVTQYQEREAERHNRGETGGSVV